MKVVAYGIGPEEKKMLAKANTKQHDITVISNPLNLQTVDYSTGKTAVIVADPHGINTSLLFILSGLGIEYILCWCLPLKEVDLNYAVEKNILVINISDGEPECPRTEVSTLSGFSPTQIRHLAAHTIETLNELQESV